MSDSFPSASAPLPSLFVSHGSPMLALQPGRTGPLLARVGRSLPAPRAILMVSPHWETATPRVHAAPQPRTIHDFGGFPPELYALDYPVAGDPQLAQQVADLLRADGLDARTDVQWGLDHGAWVPLRYLFPKAETPVVQLSLQSHQPPAYHFRIGRLLSGLANDGVLLVGSGSFTHNLRELQRQYLGPDGRAAAEDAGVPHTQEFLEWFLQRMQAGDLDALLDYRASAPHAVRNHPSDEHLLSLYFAMGAADDWTRFRHLDSGSTYGSLRMDAFAFGSGANALVMEESDAAGALAQ